MAKANHLQTMLFVAILAIVAYLPTLSQPLIEDDYPNIALSRSYGPVSGWREMFQDDVNRVRMTTWVLMYEAEHIFGLSPVAFYSISILLHILSCWLIYALGRWDLLGFRTSAWSAAFFAIYEGHQEAIMWYSACNELLQFIFGISALVCFIVFLENGRRRWVWYGLALLSFLWALLSKESAVIFVPLLAIPMLEKGFRLRSLIYLLPFAVVALFTAATIFLARSHSFRFSDGSFELTAPFWITWTKSFFALLWFWGWLAVIALVKWRQSLRLLLMALIWISDQPDSLHVPDVSTSHPEPADIFGKCGSCVYCRGRYCSSLAAFPR